MNQYRYEKKSRVNITLFDFIIILFFAFSCLKNSKVPKKGILLKVDDDFSAMSGKEGMHKATLFYFASTGVILRNNSYPLEGKESLGALFAKDDDSEFKLTWVPRFEKLSLSGDIGYTYGVYTNKGKATGNVSKGTYVTIWEKQKEGTWKFVLDTGTQGLPEDLK